MFSSSVTACKNVVSNDLRLLSVGFAALGTTYIMNSLGILAISQTNRDGSERLRKDAMWGYASGVVGYLTYQLLQPRLSIVPMGLPEKVALAMQSVLMYCTCYLFIPEDYKRFQNLFLSAAVIPLSGLFPTKHVFKWAAGIGAVCALLQKPWDHPFIEKFVAYATRFRGKASQV